MKAYSRVLVDTIEFTVLMVTSNNPDIALSIWRIELLFDASGVTNCSGIKQGQGGPKRGELTALEMIHFVWET